MFSSILIAIDGLEHTTQLLNLARRMCIVQTKVFLIHVDSRFPNKIEHIKYVDNMDMGVMSNGEQLMQDALGYLKLTAGIEAEGVIVGGGRDIASAILKYAEQIGCDLIVIGHYHLSRINRFFDPSIAIKVAKNARC